MNKRVGWVLRGTRLLVCGCAFLCLLGAYVWCFASFAYERIPNWIGGGKPQRARIEFKHDAAIRRRANGDPGMPCGSNRSLPLDLLFQTEKVLYVRTGPPDVRQTNKEEVLDVDIKPPNSGLEWEFSDVEIEEGKLIAQLRSLDRGKRQQLVDDLFRDINNNVLRWQGVKVSAEYYPDSSYTISEQYKESRPFDWQCDLSNCYGLAWEFQWLKDRAAKASGGQPQCDWGGL